METGSSTFQNHFPEFAGNLSLIIDTGAKPEAWLCGNGQFLKSFQLSQFPSWEVVKPLLISEGINPDAIEKVIWLNKSEKVHLVPEIVISALAEHHNIFSLEADEVRMEEKMKQPEAVLVTHISAMQRHSLMISYPWFRPVHILRAMCQRCLTINLPEVVVIALDTDKLFLVACKNGSLRLANVYPIQAEHEILYYTALVQNTLEFSQDMLCYFYGTEYSDAVMPMFVRYYANCSYNGNVESRAIRENICRDILSCA
jgi:hypothetical protein